MPAIVIPVDHEVKPSDFDLIDILCQFEIETKLSVWRVERLECLGRNAERLHSLADRDVRIPGDQLMDIARGLLQTIDGDFSAYQPGTERCWLRLRAVDSTCFVIESNDEIIQRVKSRFANAKNSPDDQQHDLDPNIPR